MKKGSTIVEISLLSSPSTNLATRLPFSQLKFHRSKNLQVGQLVSCMNFLLPTHTDQALRLERQLPSTFVTSTAPPQDSDWQYNQPSIHPSQDLDKEGELSDWGPVWLLVIPTSCSQRNKITGRLSGCVRSFMDCHHMPDFVPGQNWPERYPY